jgi:phosphoglycolate phosphatase
MPHPYLYPRLPLTFPTCTRAQTRRACHAFPAFFGFPAPRILLALARARSESQRAFRSGTMRNPPLLIFDLDGTLVHSLPGIAASLNRALAAQDLPTHAEAAVRGFVGDGARMLATRALPAGADETLIARLERDFKADYAVTWATGSVVFDGIPAMLAELRTLGARLAVLSNKPHPFTVAMVDTMFPEAPFAMVLGQRAEIPHKPDPAGLREIIATLDARLEDAWMIGDSATDLATARNAGIPAVAVSWGYRDREELEALEKAFLVDHPSLIVALAASLVRGDRFGAA